MHVSIKIFIHVCVDIFKRLCCVHVQNTAYMHMYTWIVCKQFLFLILNAIPSLELVLLFLCLFNSRR